MSGRGRGATVLHVVTDGIIVGVVELEDQVRPESREAVEALHKQGIKVAMITGDAEQVAKAVAADLGIRSLAGELRHRGIRVNAVSPGPVDTPASTARI